MSLICLCRICVSCHSSLFCLVCQSCPSCPNMSQNVAAKKFRYAVAKNTTKPEIAFCALHVVSSKTIIYLFAPFCEFEMLDSAKYCSNLITPGGIPSNLGNPAPGHCYHLLDYNRLPLQDLRECFERKRYSRVPILQFLWILFNSKNSSKTTFLN